MTLPKPFEMIGGMAGESRVTHSGSDSFSPRRFTPETLEAIEEILSGPPFEEREWEIIEGARTHRADSLTAVLRTVVWETVTGFEGRARQYVKRDNNLRSGNITVAAYQFSRTPIATARWSSDAECDRDGIERAYNKVKVLMEALPKAGRSNIFTTRGAEGERLGAEAERAQRRRLWQVWRPPESFADWLLSGVVVVIILGVAVSVIAGVILLALQ